MPTVRWVFLCGDIEFGFERECQWRPVARKPEAVITLVDRYDIICVYNGSRSGENGAYRRG